jgi:energy-coupling factor transporter ATP-binding protein EcfA2
MIILGMTGPIGHGKTTFANALADIIPATVHLESSLIIAEVVNEWHKTIRKIPDPYDVDSLNEWIKFLPPILSNVVHAESTFDQIKLDQRLIEQHPIEYQKLIMHVENLRRNPELAKQVINKDNKESYRPILQWVGGYLVQQVDSGIWYDELVRRIEQAGHSGAELCLVGGLRFPTDANILRNAGALIVKIYRPGHLQNDMLDPTERERANIKSDCTIMSNGTVEDIRRFALRFLEDIRANKVERLYQTKNYITD